MDFIVGLPESHRKACKKGKEIERGVGCRCSYNVIPVIVDRYSNVAC